MQDTLRILCFADVVGRTGRRAIAACLPEIRKQYQPHILVANVENLAGGRGVNRKSLFEMKELGFHIFTSGNHIWDNKEVYTLLESENLLRPANYPSTESAPCPGRGYGIFEVQGRKLAVLNLMGRVFMDAIDCPFQAADNILRKLPPNIPVLVDFHADATSEKNAIGWYLDGRVSAVVGSHSHVQTADERILPKGTAFITDVGMSGGFDSIIGCTREEILRKFVTKRPHPFQVSQENPGISAVVIWVHPSGKAERIERIRRTVTLDGKDSDLT